MECPRCGSDDIRKIGRIISLTGKKQRYSCEKGHTFQDKRDYVKGRIIPGNRKRKRLTW